MSSEDPTRPFRSKSLEDRVAELERKFNERGYDTRPLFEAHEKRIAQLETTIEQLKGGRIGPLTFDHGLYWAANDNVPFVLTVGKVNHMKNGISNRSKIQVTIGVPSVRTSFAICVTKIRAGRTTYSCILEYRDVIQNNKSFTLVECLKKSAAWRRRREIFIESRAIDITPLRSH